MAAYVAALDEALEEIQENIDDLIEYATDNKKTEAYTILVNYKNETFGFDDAFAKYKIWLIKPYTVCKQILCMVFILDNWGYVMENL